MRFWEYNLMLMMNRLKKHIEKYFFYLKLSLKLHPDKSNHPQAKDAFKKLNRAYICLSDSN